MQSEDRLVGVRKQLENIKSITGKDFFIDFNDGAIIVRRGDSSVFVKGDAFYCFEAIFFYVMGYNDALAVRK